MAATRVGRVGIVAVTLAVIGGIVALVRETVQYRQTGAVDWGHVALAFGVPALICAIAWGAAARRPH